MALFGANPRRADRICLYRDCRFDRFRFRDRPGNDRGVASSGSSRPDLAAEFSSEPYTRGVVGMARSAEGLKKALGMIRTLKEQYWRDVRVTGTNEEPNQALEKAGRVADFMELGELMVDDALNRNESCGGHFREEYQTEEGEAKRNDEEFAYVSAWQYHENGPEELHKEKLEFENVVLTQRSYK